MNNIEAVSQNRNLHSHMMTVATRAVQAASKEKRWPLSEKVLIRTICKAIQQDKNLIKKIAALQDQIENEPYAIEAGFDNGDGTYSVRIEPLPLNGCRRHKDYFKFEKLLFLKPQKE